MDLNDIFGPDKPIDLVNPEDVAVGEYIYGNVPVYRSIPGTQSYGFSPFSTMGQSQAFDFRDDMSLTSISMGPANEICSTANIEEHIVSSHTNIATLKEQIGSVQLNYDCVPEQPSFLVPTHFEIRARIEEINSKINHYLLINPTISFEFSSSDYQVEISHFLTNSSLSFNFGTFHSGMVLLSKDLRIANLLSIFIKGIIIVF